jgi:hypothetical protein
MMSNKRLLFGLLLLVIGGWTLSSCTKNDDTTIVAIGTEYYIDDILSVIPDSLQADFMAKFGDIPEGAMPPKIEGGYKIDPKVRIGSNLEGWPLLTEPHPVLLKLKRQHNGVAAINLFEEEENVTDTVFVCGRGTNFAIYFIEEKDYELAWLRRGVIIKGQKTEQGIADLRMAQIVLETEDHTNGQHIPSPVGTYYLYKDGDGLAENYDW